MRRFRWLFLAAILGILVSIGATYFRQKRTLASNAPVPPQPLEAGVAARANDWVYTQSDGSRPHVTVRAKNFRQVKAPSVMELDGVELQLFNKDATEFDLVKCAKAQFDTLAKSLYSDGDVEITMSVPADGPPRGRVLKIHGSGVRFESDTGKASTDRATTFDFDQGSGSAVGSDYDPSTRELHLRSQVVLDWRGKTADSPPMHVEAGEAYYRERDSKVTLLPWSKLTRGLLNMEAKASVVTLDKGEIRQADVEAGRGVQEDPDRRVEFAANQLAMHFGDGMVMEKIEGSGNSRLVSTTPAMRTTVTGDHVDVDFAPTGKESLLTAATARGNGVAEAQPVGKPGADLPDTRVLRSDTIHLKMRPGGQEMESVETEGPGTVDFLPNRAGQPKRWLKGDRIWLAYGEGNRIQSFRSINASTRTEKPAEKGKPAPPPALTESKEITAAFDPKTSELSRLEQKTNFRYEEGSRRASADSATLEQPKDLMTLEGSARVWDPTGSVSADHIVMNQKSGDFAAEGHVASTHMPDKTGNSSAMLSSDEILQTRAQKMVSTDSNSVIHYEGNAVAWQGASRVEADRIDIDRNGQSFEAHGKVISQFADKSQDKSKPDTAKQDVSRQDRAKSPPSKASAQKSSQAKEPAAKPVAPSTKPENSGPPVFTKVQAQDLVYDGGTRIANYTGGVTLTRPGLNVTGKEMHVYLKDSGSDSSLDKAFADGAVKIVSTNSAKKIRNGASEHAEYYADDQRVILTGGDPTLADAVKGQTHGQELTLFLNNDRLLVNGEEKRPADSILRKK